jgi:hypothetical protein
MSRPWCHPETGVWYLRSRLPAALAKSLGGQRLPSKSPALRAPSSSPRSSRCRSVRRTPERQGCAMLQCGPTSRALGRREVWCSLPVPQGDHSAGWHLVSRPRHGSPRRTRQYWRLDTLPGLSEGWARLLRSRGRRHQTSPMTQNRAPASSHGGSTFLTARGLNLHQSRTKLIEHVAGIFAGLYTRDHPGRSCNNEIGECHEFFASASRRQRRPHS